MTRVGAPRALSGAPRVMNVDFLARRLVRPLNEAGRSTEPDIPRAAAEEALTTFYRGVRDAHAKAEQGDTPAAALLKALAKAQALTAAFALLARPPLCFALGEAHRATFAAAALLCMPPPQRFDDEDMGSGVSGAVAHAAALEVSHWSTRGMSEVSFVTSPPSHLRYCLPRPHLCFNEAFGAGALRHAINAVGLEVCLFERSSRRR